MYRLVLARKDGALGPQLVKSEVDCAELRRRGERLPVAADSNSRAVTPCTMRVGMGEMVTGARSFPDFVSFLESVVRRRIIDETGLTGAFDITLTWSYRPTDTTRPSIFTAVQEQLGLKLESARGPLNVLIIDTIERPTPD